jgi:hypothetical protein
MSSQYAHLFPFAARNSGSYFFGILGNRRPPSPLVAGLLVCQHPMATSDNPVRDIVAGNWRRLISRLAFSHHYEGDHYRNCFLTMDILAGNF